MNNSSFPPSSDTTSDFMYTTFGARLAAVLLDGLILSPLSILVLIYNAMDLYNFYYSVGFTVAATLLYYILLPAKFGATPGKRLMGLRILKSDGREITYKDAFLRYLPSFILSVIAIASTLVALQFADPEIFNTAKWIDKTSYLVELNPRMYYSEMVLSNIFLVGNLVVFLSNPKARSIFDFSGDTVVVYDRFLSKRRAEATSTSSEKDTE